MNKWMQSAAICSNYNKAWFDLQSESEAHWRRYSSLEATLCWEHWYRYYFDYVGVFPVSRNREIEHTRDWFTLGVKYTLYTLWTLTKGTHLYKITLSGRNKNRHGVVIQTLTNCIKETHNTRKYASDMFKLTKNIAISVFMIQVPKRFSNSDDVLI